MKTAVFARSLLVLSLATAIGIAYQSPARAASEAQTLRRMVDLNKRALSAHAAGRHQTARKVLLDALAAGKAAGLEKHDMTARTHIHLAVVSIVGLKQREDGVAHFAEAVRIRPDIRLTPKLTTPALEAELELVRRSLPPAPAPGQPLAVASLPPAGSPKLKEPGRAQKIGRGQSDEPDVPVSIPQPLYCPVPIEGPPEREVNLRCLTQPEIRVSRVVAYYRPATGETYLALPMSRSKKGWYSAVVPANQVTGRSLQFYFEAHGDGNAVAVRNGKEDSPNVIVLKEGAPPVGIGALAALQSLADSSGAAVTEQSPLEVRENELAASERRAQLGRRAPGSIWLGLGLGSGLGWHRRRPLERHPRRSVTTGISPTGLGHLVPELGWQIGERASLSLQGRHQYLPASGSGDAEATGTPPTTAHAVMARLQYSLIDLADFEVLGSATLGGGSALRMKVEAARQLGLVTSDTVVVGPLVGGLGLGLAYNFNSHILALAEARGLAAGWNFGVLGEINAGVQVAF